jgi:hypothetical protein
MSDSKIEIKVGNISFSGQGEQDWVANQLDKILAQAEKLIQLAPEDKDNGPIVEGKSPIGMDLSIAKQTLRAFLQEKNATQNQVKKFLATASWLESKGQTRIQTSDVIKALKDANQTKLGNAADCLNKNVTKGHCEKDGNTFFVTDDGKKSL